MNEIISWLGRQFRNQTFEDDVEVKIDEMRELLDLSDDCDGAEVGLGLDEDLGLGELKHD